MSLENDLYEEWKNAGENERPAIRERLAEVLTKHFRKALLKKYRELNEEAVQEGVIAALANIDKFEGAMQSSALGLIESY